MPPPTSRRATPPSIHVAALSLLFAAAVQAGIAFTLSSTSRVGFGQWLFAAAVMALLLWGIVRGYRLAWLWGRYLAAFLAAMVVATVGFGVWKGHMGWVAAAVVLGGLVLPLAAVSLALGRPSALRWFDLVCPKCQAASTRGKDFLFREARCPACGNVW
jgi:hypothetical protein